MISLSSENGSNESGNNKRESNKSGGSKSNETAPLRSYYFAPLSLRNDIDSFQSVYLNIPSVELSLYKHVIVFVLHHNICFF